MLEDACSEVGQGESRNARTECLGTTVRYEALAPKLISRLLLARGSETHKRLSTVRKVRNLCSPEGFLDCDTPAVCASAFAISRRIIEL